MIKKHEFKSGTWIRLESPEDWELEKVTEEFDLDKDLLRDALDPYEVPRLERKGEVSYFFTRVPNMEEDRTVTRPLLLVLDKNFLISVSSTKMDILYKAYETSSSTKTQTINLFLRIFNIIDREYISFFNSVAKRVRSVSIQIGKIRNRDIVQFVQFEEVLNDFTSALIATNGALNGLLAGRSVDLYEKDRDAIQDLFLENGQLIESAKSTLKNIVNTREAYSAIMTHDLNRVIKLLTALTIILNVPVLVSSFFGMNVPLPLAGSPMAFWWIALSTAGISLILLVVFAINRWV